MNVKTNVVELINKERKATLQKTKSDIEEQNSFLQSINSILQTESEEDEKMLRDIGFKIFQDKENVKRSINGNIASYESLSRENNIILFDELLQVCVKYDLRILSPSFYKGNVPGDLVSEIKKFKEKYFEFENEDNNISRFVDSSRGYRKRLILKKEWQKKLSKHSKSEIIFNEDNFRMVAPSNMFKLEDQPKVTFSNGDPALVYQFGYRNSESCFILIKGWGKDFTVFRRLRSLFLNTRPEQLLFAKIMYFLLPTFLFIWELVHTAQGKEKLEGTFIIAPVGKFFQSIFGFDYWEKGAGAGVTFIYSFILIIAIIFGAFIYSENEIKVRKIKSNIVLTNINLINKDHRNDLIKFSIFLGFIYIPIIVINFFY